MRWVTHTRVLSVRKEMRKIYLSGFGEEAKFREQSLGWYMHLEGSYESLHLGFEKPEIHAGDRVKITVEKVNGDAGDKTGG
jgi:hypothetical protein